LEPRRRIIYTDAAKERRARLIDEVSAKLESILVERKFVPGEDVVELTASDVDEVARTLEFHFRDRYEQRARFQQLVTSSYLAIGVLLVIAGLFLEYVQVLLESPTQRLLVVMGMLMTAMSIVLRSSMRSRAARYERLRDTLHVIDERARDLPESARDPVLSRELDSLAREAKAAADMPLRADIGTIDTSERGVLEGAARAPKAALMLLGSDIERELRELLAATGQLALRRYTSVPHEIARLELPGHLRESVVQFWAVRSKLVHGRDAGPDDIARAIDSGLLILNAIRALPREINVVHHAGTAVYADVQGHIPRTGVKALILETTGTDGTRRFRIFPTTRNDYVKGQRVAWEWSGKNIFGESWYLDPDGDDIKYAWSESMEFVGRALDEAAHADTSS